MLIVEVELTTVNVIVHSLIIRKIIIAVMDATGEVAKRKPGKKLRLQYKPEFFSGFLFLSAQVASIAAMIIFPLILHPAVHVYDYHIFITSHSLIVDIKEIQV